MSTNSLLSQIPRNLAGKTVLITGASSGIGRSTAFEFSRTQPDINLILAARRIETVQEVAKEIEAESGGRTKVLALKLDVSDLAAVKRFWEVEVPREWKERGVDVLVNNAGGVRGLEHVGEIAEEDVATMIGVNVMGLIGLTQHVVRHFKNDRGGKGDIVNIGSIAGREPYAGGSIYCATKAAVRSFSDSLRRENISNQIRVIEIDPGQVETEFSVVRFRGDKAKADAVYAGCDPLGPEDIAGVIVFAVGQRQGVVLADSLIFPQHQAGAGAVYKRPA
ncbi:NAD(P)-binding protein [Ascodesmis nigricans]|uniref:NAD(P)-binding protein n=1 Tax=Ascodesmis nigricans TaxID=341454 RepID=A0A4S2MPW8_9PEZI|nr:NAD(P)-binding protein [Ascodesmis nigricans]